MVQKKMNKTIQNKTDGVIRFGTFGGVFTPCTLTILGVIMFLRFGQVVGNAGIWHGLLIVGMAKLVTILTSLSLSAIATNSRVKGGGAYYMISRSLGIEFGGAIGLVFFLSQAVSVAMYIIGFTEALTSVIPALSNHFRLSASVVNLVVFICVYIGAGWTIKIQYAILLILLGAIVSFIGGAIGHWNQAHLIENLNPKYGDSQNLWTMFALFFPAATGIMAGANMSGDLADPGKSIPRGTVSAIVFTGMIYGAFVLFLGASADRNALQTEHMIVSRLAWQPGFILAGVFAATLSSALGSLMGAPRILQALARDRVFGILNFFSRGSGINNEPRRATILSYLIAQAGIMLGDLNAIAPITTMFFMITYGALNYAAFQEGCSGNPSYRPRFKYNHWSLSLLGALCCVIAMLLIDWLWAVIALLLMVAIYRYLVREEMEAAWGDLQSGAALGRVRRELLNLEEMSYHPKNWRPVIIAFGVHREERLHMAAMARWLAGPTGMLIIGQVITSEDDDILERHRQARRQLRKRISENELEAFPAVTIAPSLTSGLSALTQCSGVGAIHPNLVLFNWTNDEEKQAGLLTNMKMVTRLGRSLALLRYQPPPTEDIWAVPSGTIDVWWLGLGNGSLMLLLGHLLQHNNGWRDHRIRLIRMIKDEAGREETRQYLEQLATDARIPAECKVLIGDEFTEILVRESSGSALCILGLQNPIEMPDGAIKKLASMTDRLTRLLFIHSAGDMSLEV